MEKKFKKMCQKSTFARDDWKAVREKKRVRVIEVIEWEHN